MTLRELLQNEIVALEERHRKEDMGLQREMEQATEQSMAVSIAEAEAHATQAVEGQAGKTKQERHLRRRRWANGVENGPLGMREVRLEDVRTLKLHEQDDSILGVSLDYINGITRRSRWSDILLSCRRGLFETQGRWLVCAFEHMSILEIPLAEFVDWKDKMRERISDWSYDALGIRWLDQLPHILGLLANGMTNFDLVLAASGRVPAEIVSRLAVRVRMRRALEVRTLLSLRRISMLQMARLGPSTGDLRVPNVRQPLPGFAMGSKRGVQVTAFRRCTVGSCR
ncbi:hypothetical protein DYB37_012601 [Aphanomyces astaci]|uniref:Uncharacterized protein n=1 Tax=Aphanomyces astaci TaxID=112090 RepID=A0A3R7B8B9_APHAT|nr:hypothetical protein DYB35_012501 [Aphanomyces astaci]RHZ32278.1 hypothetical protein DYB37_012601 [Aphanomyces astaci]